MEIHYSLKCQKRLTEDGRTVPETEFITLVYGGISEWCICIPHEIPEVVSWRAAVGAWEKSGNPVCRIPGTQISVINQDGKWRIMVPVNTRTTEFRETVKDGAAFSQFELTGLNANGNIAVHVYFRVMLLPSNDPDGGDPLQTADDLATMSWVKSLIQGDGDFLDRSTFENKVRELENSLGKKLEETDLSDYLKRQEYEAHLIQMAEFRDLLDIQEKELSGKADAAALIEKTDVAVFNETVESLSQQIRDVKQTKGLLIRSAESETIIFRNNTVVKYEVAEGDSFTFDVSEIVSGYCANMELWLSMKDSVKSFSFPADLVWVDGVTPKFNTANREYVIVLRWDGTRLIANLAYSVEVN